MSKQSEKTAEETSDVELIKAQIERHADVMSGMPPGRHRDKEQTVMNRLLKSLKDAEDAERNTRSAPAVEAYVEAPTLQIGQEHGSACCNALCGHHPNCPDTQLSAELPPLDEYTRDQGDRVEESVIHAIRTWDCATSLDWKLRATAELQKSHRALDQANYQVSCRERQLRHMQAELMQYQESFNQVEKAMRDYRDKLAVTTEALRELRNSHFDQACEIAYYASAYLAGCAAHGKEPKMYNSNLNKSHIGSVVHVDHGRYHGYGILSNITDPIQSIAMVRLEHGHDRPFEANTVRPMGPEDHLPAWIGRIAKADAILAPHKDAEVQG